MIRIVLENLSGQVFGLDDSFVTDVAYTKEEIDVKLTAVLKFRGTVATKSQLPLTNLTRGDVWAVTQDNLEYVWLLDRNYATSVDEWEQLGPIHDLSAYYTKTEINNMLGSIPEGRTIMDLIGSNIPEGTSLKDLIDALTNRMSTAESDIDVLETTTSDLTTKTNELFSRVGDGPYKTPVEPQFLADFEYYKKNADNTFTQLVAGTDYNVGDAMREGVYRCYSDKNLSERMFVAEQTAVGHTARIESLEERTTTAESDIVNLQNRATGAEENITALQGDVSSLQGDMTTVQTNLSNLQQEVWNEVYPRIDDTLYWYNYAFDTGTLSDPRDITKSSDTCWSRISGQIQGNKAIRLTSSDCEACGSEFADFRFVNYKKTSTEIKEEEVVTGYHKEMDAYFYTHRPDESLIQLLIKLSWDENTTGGQVGDLTVEEVTAKKLQFNYYVKDSEDDKPTIAQRGDICVVRKLLGDDTTYQYTGYVWNGTMWAAMDGNYSADNVIMPENIAFLGDYSAVGNIKFVKGAELECKGWTVKKLFKEIFYKAINPTLGAVPTVSVTFGSAGSKEVGTEITPSYSLTYNQGKYNQPWDGGTQNDGTTAKNWYCTDSNGVQKTTQTGTFDSFTVVDTTSYKVTGKADYNAGTYGKDNTGAETTIRREAGTTAEKASSSVTPFRYMYIGSIATDADVTEDVIKGLTKFTCGAVTKTLKASGGDIPLVSGAVKVIVAIPVKTGSSKSAVGGYELNQVLLVSASNTPITSDYKAKDNVSVSGKVSGQNMKDYKVWVYQPASIDPGEIHSIKIA